MDRRAAVVSGASGGEIPTSRVRTHELSAANLERAPDARTPPAGRSHPRAAAVRAMDRAVRAMDRAVRARYSVAMSERVDGRRPRRARAGARRRGR